MPHPTKRRLFLGSLFVVIVGFILIIQPLTVQAAQEVEVVRKIKSLPKNNDWVREMISFKEKGYILTSGDVSIPDKLWITDGTKSGTKPIKIFSGGVRYYGFLGKRKPDSYGMYETAEPVFFKGNFFFFIDNSLWKSNGTSLGTIPVSSLLPSSGSVDTAVILDQILYFRWGEDIWRTDGTQSGTWLVNSSEVSLKKDMISFKGRLYFQGYSSHHGEELWVSDGTPSGTSLFADINPFNARPDCPHRPIESLSPSEQCGNDSKPGSFVVCNDDLYFTADDGLRGRSLWVTNGTRDGTRVVTELNSGLDDDYLDNFICFNNYLLFEGNNRNLWRTDGSPTGTVLVAGNYSISELMGKLGGYLYLAAFTSNSNTLFDFGILRTNGTPSGTQFIKRNINANSLHGSNTGILKEKIYFGGYSSGNYGNELWVTDGTSKGTKLVENIFPGVDSYGQPHSSFPRGFIKIGDSLLFIATYSFYYNERGYIDYRNGLFKLTLREPAVMAPILDLLLLSDEK